MPPQCKLSDVLLWGRTPELGDSGVARMPLLLRLALLAVLLWCQAQRAAAAHPNGTTPNSNSTSGAAATLSRRALQAGSWPAGAGGAVWGWGNNNNGRLGIASSSTADRKVAAN